MSGESIIAYCGLVCSECGAFKKQKCQGCHSEKPMNRGCKIKKCAMSKNIVTCAACDEFDDLKQCKKLNNFISKIFKLIFKSDRMGNLELIRCKGLEEFKSQRNLRNLWHSYQ
ncbi:MAG: DUF3795 domain-containing protein [Phycisphaerae bacterium]